PVRRKPAGATVGKPGKRARQQRTRRAVDRNDRRRRRPSRRPGGGPPCAWPSRDARAGAKPLDLVGRVAQGLLASANRREGVMTGLRSIAACAAPYRGAQLCDVRRLAEMLPGLDEGVLLHAGPPYEGRPAPAPVRNAAAQALLFEGAAADFEEALRLLDGDEYFLAPAQDY